MSQTPIKSEVETKHVSNASLGRSSVRSTIENKAGNLRELNTATTDVPPRIAAPRALLRPDTQGMEFSHGESNHKSDHLKMRAMYGHASSTMQRSSLGSVPKTTRVLPNLRKPSTSVKLSPRLGVYRGCVLKSPNIIQRQPDEVVPQISKSIYQKIRDQELLA